MRPTIIVAAAIATITSTVGFAQLPQKRFTHAGKTYAYTRTEAGKGQQVIEGRSLSDNTPFRLIVRGDRVSGTVGSVPVGFKVGDARGAAAGRVELAAQ